MVTFRFHRGGLKESLDTSIEVESVDKLFETIKPKGFMNVSYYGYDSRIKWETYIVCDEAGPIGFLKFN